MIMISVAKEIFGPGSLPRKLEELVPGLADDNNTYRVRWHIVGKIDEFRWPIVREIYTELAEHHDYMVVIND